MSMMNGRNALLNDFRNVNDPEPEPPRPTLQGMLAAARWRPIDWAGVTPPEGLPFATHVARVQFPSGNYRCFTLSDGRRLVDYGDRSEFSVPAALDPK